jgi:hypothetical protein
MNDRLQAETAVANLLMARIRADKYPSTTHMNMLEQMIPRHAVRDYLNVLMEKVLMDDHPSISMLHRIIRAAQSV